MINMSLADYLAQLPYQVGYELADQHIMVVGQIERIPVLSAAIEWPDGRTLIHQAEGISTQVLPVMQRAGATGMILIGYGPNGPERVEALAQAIAASSATPPAPVLVHVENDQYRSRDELDPEWSSWSDVGPAPIEHVVNGHPAPAPTREAVLQRYAPLPQPTFTHASPSDAQRLDGLLPSLRAEIATRTLDLLTDNATDQVPRALATVAHLVQSDRQVRDAVIVHAAQEPARADTLVRLYRSAPKDMQPDLAATAATTLYLSSSNTIAASAALLHAAPNLLALLTQAAIETGTPPDRLLPGLAASIAGGLAEADRQHESQLTDKLRAAAFPGRPAPGTSAAATPHQTTGPAHIRNKGTSPEL